MKRISVFLAVLLLGACGFCFAEEQDDFEQVLRPASQIGYSISTAADRFFLGGDVLFIVHLYNRGDKEQEVTVKYWDDNKAGEPAWAAWDGPNAERKVRIPKLGESGFFFIHRKVERLKGSAFDAYFYDSEGKEIGYLVKGIQPAPNTQTVKIKIDIDKQVYEINDNVKAMITLENLKDEKRIIKLIIRAFDPQKNLIFASEIPQPLDPNEIKKYLVDFTFTPQDSQYDSVIVVKAKQGTNLQGIGFEYIGNAKPISR